MYDFQKVDKTQVPDEVLDVFEARRDKLVGRGKAHEFPFEFFYRVLEIAGIPKMPIYCFYIALLQKNKT